MPSFLKKILYGKDLSNPYVNPYHPGHGTYSTPASQQQQQTPYPYPTHPQPAIHFPPHRPASVEPPLYTDFLGEARRIAGRDPVTGRPVQSTQLSPDTSIDVNGEQRGSADGNGNENGRRSADEPNPYVSGRDAAMGRPVVQGVVKHAESFVAEGNARGSGRGDSSREGRDDSGREERGGEVGGRAHGGLDAGFYAPERPVVREFYGGT